MLVLSSLTATMMMFIMMMMMMMMMMGSYQYYDKRTPHEGLGGLGGMSSSCSCVPCGFQFLLFFFEIKLLRYLFSVLNSPCCHTVQYCPRFMRYSNLKFALQSVNIGEVHSMLLQQTHYFFLFSGGTRER